jgi:hypothetical protein
MAIDQIGRKLYTRTARVESEDMVDETSFEQHKYPEKRM